MKVHVRRWHAIAQWQWDTGKAGDAAEEEDVCGICRVPFEGCCPSCKVPGDDCPLSESRSPARAPRRAPVLTRPSISARARVAVWGECSHVFHMHCLLKWIGTPASKQQCPMDRRPWGACSFTLPALPDTRPRAADLCLSRNSHRGEKGGPTADERRLEPALFAARTIYLPLCSYTPHPPALAISVRSLDFLPSCTLAPTTNRHAIVPKNVT